MDEKLLKEILTEAYDLEFAELTAGDEHRFSLRHRMRMRKMLRRYDNSAAMPSPAAARPAMRRRLTVVLLIILTAVILAVTVIALVTNGFKKIEKEDHTEFLALDEINVPEVIEEVYELGWIPEGFELIEYYEGRNVIKSKYISETSNFTLRQHTKLAFYGYINSEKYNYENIIIDCNNGLFWQKDEVNYICWDTGNYVISVYGNIPKDTLVKLAESTKLKKVEK